MESIFSKAVSGLGQRNKRCVFIFQLLDAVLLKEGYVTSIFLALITSGGCFYILIWMAMNLRLRLANRKI